MSSTQTDEQRGPTVKRFCQGCVFYESEPFRVQGDHGWDRFCTANGERRSLDSPYTAAQTPDWCPYLPTVAPQTPASERAVEYVIDHAGHIVGCTHCAGPSAGAQPEGPRVTLEQVEKLIYSLSGPGATKRELMYIFSRVVHS